MSSLIEKINESLKLGLNFLISMSKFIDENLYAVYEKYMVNALRIKRLFRPDCTAEFGILLRELSLSDNNIDKIRFGIKNWLIKSIHNERYYFGFDEELNKWIEQAWVNDNSKVLLYFLDENEDGIKIAKRIANFLLDAQDSSGGFRACVTNDGAWSPVFITTTTWAVYSLLKLYNLTNDETYLQPALRGLNWLKSKQKINGRMTTTYELYKGEPMRENWRPPSSETAEVILPFSEAVKLGFNEYRKNMQLAIKWLISLQHPSGGIKNCDEESMGASEQNNPDLADMVYTNSYALVSSIEALKILKTDMQLKKFIEKLALFLMDTQVKDEVPWKGGWRGSYSLSRQTWAGRAIFGGNIEEEGGMYSVYTGWSTAVILTGLTRLHQVLKENF